MAKCSEREGEDFHDAGDEIGQAKEGHTILGKGDDCGIACQESQEKIRQKNENDAEGKADAALAASIFHYGEVSISDLKKKLQEQNIKVRL